MPLFPPRRNSPGQPRECASSVRACLGERKIDVLVVGPTTELEPVHRLARAEGVLLQA